MLAFPESPSTVRQAWLEHVLVACRSRIEDTGAEVPAAIRISCGFPKGSHGNGKAICQCWGIEASADKHNEIFISPELCNSVQIFGVVAHELVHATVGVAAGHKKPFKKLATEIGLVGKMTATTEGEEFRIWAEGIIHQIGIYPAGAMSANSRKKQVSRQLKCSCSTCGYVARTTRKWVEDAGPPICPTDMVSMVCDDVDGDDDE